MQKVREVYQDDWDAIVADARQTLLENAHYYRKVLSGKEPIETSPETTEEFEPIEEEEQ